MAADRAVVAGRVGRAGRAVVEPEREPPANREVPVELAAPEARVVDGGLVYDLGSATPLL